MRIGIMSAMQEENSLIIAKMESVEKSECAGRVYAEGCFCGMDVVIAFSRWGKVAASITASHLINNFNVDLIVFTGVAGACASEVKVGDIIVADDLIQHDMDARPIFERYEIPLTGVQAFSTDAHWKKRLYEAATSFAIQERAAPSVHLGRIVSGDKFFASKNDILDLKNRIPEALCVEMEGAAVAQVCVEHEIPFAVVRTVSDTGEESSPEQFQKFIETVASRYSLGILEHLLHNESKRFSI